MVGTCKGNGSGSNAEEDDGRKTVHRKKKGKTLLKMDRYVVADLKVMKIKQWMEKRKDRQQWRLVVEETKAHPWL